MKRIAAIVYNSVSHDSRVLKEADSLASAGYQVKIIGIMDNYCMDARTRRDTGVEIFRVSWRSLVYSRVAKLSVAVLIGLLLAYLAVFDTVYDSLTFLFYDSFSFRRLSKLLGFVLLLAGGTYFVARAFRLARRYGKLEGIQVSSRRRPQLIKQLLYIVKRARHTMAMKSRVLDALVEFAPHAVHCHDLPTVAAGYAYAQRSGCKLVYDSHEIYEELGHGGVLFRRFFELVQRHFSSKLDAFVTINKSIADFLQTKYPRLPPAIIVKNASLPVSGLEYDGRLHEAAELEQNQRILLYQGGFADNRGLDVLVRAAPMLPSDWCVVMMGWGAYERELRDIAKAVDPDFRHIRFVARAPQEELVQWTAGGTVGVIPYKNVSLNHWYCTPNKLWEYPSAGVPILVSPFPEMRAVVETYGVGWLLCEEPTPESIARIVTELKSEDIKIARDACERYSAGDNWDIYASRLRCLYEQLLTKEQRPRPHHRVINEARPS